MTSGGSSGTELPVFPFSFDQVGDVADVLEVNENAACMDLARLVLAEVARMLRIEREPDPQGYPRGQGYRRVRGVTGWYVVNPDESWEAER